MTAQGETVSGSGRVIALSQPNRSSRNVKLKSPREVFAAAMASPPITHADEIAHRCAWLAVAARDDAKRAANAQADLAFPEAA